VDLYDQLLRTAREDADAIQANERVEIAEKLAQKHGADALARQVQLRINALADETVRTRRQQELDQALAIADERDRGVAVALVALDVVPRSTIQEWLRRRKPLGE
jgi:sulfur carrier protein ThiS